jgi:ornithine carbamoyltransferase
MKDEKYAGTNQKDYLAGKNVVVLMNKTSTRTRSAFEVAAFDLGMGITFFGGTGQMGVKESIEDTAKVLGRMYDGIAFRGAGQEEVEMLEKHAGVPV